jgi:predicted nucleic acid-binding protein
VWRIFFDASALAKRYAAETGTPLVNGVFDLVPMLTMTCSTITVLETLSILVRKRNGGQIDQRSYEDAVIKFQTEVVTNAMFAITSVNDQLLHDAELFIPKHTINATDAVILRSALTLQQTLRATGDDVVLWTADKRLVRAAQREALPVLDPEVASIDAVRRMVAAQGEQ